MPGPMREGEIDRRVLQCNCYCNDIVINDLAYAICIPKTEFKHIYIFLKITQLKRSSQSKFIASVYKDLPSNIIRRKHLTLLFSSFSNTGFLGREGGDGISVLSRGTSGSTVTIPEKRQQLEVPWRLYSTG